MALRQARYPSRLIPRPGYLASNIRTESPPNVGLCVTHIWIWMRGSCERLKESPGEDHVVETAEAAPESHDARLAVTGACEEAAELSDHAHRLANGGWFGWGGTVGVMDSEQHPPGIIVQDDRGGHVRGGAGPVGGLQQPSGDHGVDDRRPPQAIGLLQLQMFNPTPRFEHVVEAFDQPAQAVVVDSGQHL